MLEAMHYTLNQLSAANPTWVQRPGENAQGHFEEMPPSAVHEFDEPSRPPLPLGRSVILAGGRPLEPAARSAGFRRKTPG